MSAPTVQSLAAKVDLLEQAALTQHHRIKDLQKAVIKMDRYIDDLLGMLKAELGCAPVPSPEPRHLHAVRDK